MKKILALVLLVCSLLVIVSMSGCTIRIRDHHRSNHHDSRDEDGPRGPGDPEGPGRHGGHGRHEEPVRTDFHSLFNRNEKIAIPSQLSIDLTQIRTGAGKIKFNLSKDDIYQGQYTMSNWNESNSLLSKAEYSEFIEVTPTTGTQYGRFTATNNDGSVIRGEYFPSSQDPGHGYCLMKDDAGNIYPFEL